MLSRWNDFEQRVVGIELQWTSCRLGLDHVLSDPRDEGEKLCTLNRAGRFEDNVAIVCI